MADRIGYRQKRARWMLVIVSLGLLLAGISVWPAVTEIELVISLLWGEQKPTSELHVFLLNAKQGLIETESKYPFILYGLDWLAFAHIVLAILFAGAIRDPVRNKWIVQCGLIMCVGVFVLAAIFVPIRNMPNIWFLFDVFFAIAAIPLIIALKDILYLEKNSVNQYQNFN